MRFAHLSDNMRSALLMAAAMTAFTFNDSFFKAASDELPLFQAMFLRGVGSTTGLLAVAMVLRQVRFDLPRRDWWLLVLRTLAEAAAAWFFLTALRHMPIANITAIMQSMPLSVTLAGAMFLGEAVGWRRLAAITVGFVGVLMIVQPGTDSFTVNSVYGVASVLCVTVRDLAARSLSRGVPSTMVALIAALGVTVFAGVGSVFEDWQPVSLIAGAQLTGAMVFVLFGYILSVATMRLGEIGFVAPFRYTSLLVALVIGYLVWGDWPDNVTLAGAALVVATGIFTFYRERALHLRQLAVLPR